MAKCYGIVWKERKNGTIFSIRLLLLFRANCFQSKTIVKCVLFRCAGVNKHANIKHRLLNMPNNINENFVIFCFTFISAVPFLIRIFFSLCCVMFFWRKVGFSSIFHFFAIVAVAAFYKWIKKIMKNRRKLFRLSQTSKYIVLYSVHSIIV